MCASHVALKDSRGFNKPVPAVLVIMGYLIVFLCLGQAMKGLPLGVAHVLWAGLAVMTVTLLSTLCTTIP
ncbi:SMR family transporter [uncultured Halomonas sp.]|uniref:DMT family transporter n=1 Tax=uncultured Halomonas sp. TaxID=173971 RepID=UPI00338F2565